MLAAAITLPEAAAFLLGVVCAAPISIVTVFVWVWGQRGRASGWTVGVPTKEIQAGEEW